MSDWKPGTVAKATVRGEQDTLVMRTQAGWVAATCRAGDSLWVDGHKIADVRALTVLDWHPWPEHVPDLVRTLRANYWSSLADQIEAQTKPPRIPEPGLYGVVSTERDGLTTYRWRSHDGWHGEDGSLHEWDDLIDPVLVREGVSE